ncbi:MAG: glycine cleavage system protein GcvH [Myxococcota bacterium]
MSEYEIPGGLRFTKEDEWVRADGDEVVVGVTDFAQSQLGDIVFVELPSVGASIEAGAPFGTIESVKAVSDLFAPISGEVVAINEALADKPELVNESCYAEGWLIRVRPGDRSQLERLLDGAAYQGSIDARNA